MRATLEGVGLGLRHEFLELVADHEDGPDFFELFPHQFHGFGGRLRRRFEAIAARFPLVTHSTALDVGGPDPLHPDLLRAVRETVAELGAPWWSDHLCWSGARGAHTSELIPLPWTPEVVRRVVARARAAEDAVGARLALENVSAMIQAPGSTLSEAEFTVEVLERGDLLMLLDLNNVIVNCKNFGGDPRAFVDALPLERVAHLHLSGHTVLRHVVVDTHVCPIPDEVWALYDHTLRRAGRLIPTLIEWDTEIPAYPQVLAEVAKARAVAGRALAKEAA